MYVFNIHINAIRVLIKRKTFYRKIAQVFGWPKVCSGFSISCYAAAAKSLQSCLTLCDPIDCSPPGSPISGILQARTLEWVAIAFSNARKCKVKVKSLSHVRLLATPWTVAFQAPPSMGFSRQEYWSGVPLIAFSTITFWLSNTPLCICTTALLSIHLLMDI